MFVETDKACLACDGILFGRPDKKFCSDRCRNNYNNRRNADETNLMRNVNNALRKNRRILLELNPEGTNKVSIRDLVDMRFDFDHFTSIYTSKYGKEYRYCYDQGYMILDESKVLLVVRPDI